MHVRVPEVRQRDGHLRVVAAVLRSLIASARSSMSRASRGRLRAVREPEVHQRGGHFRVVAAVRPLLDRERALQHVSLLRVVA